MSVASDSPHPTVTHTHTQTIYAQPTNVFVDSPPAYPPPPMYAAPPPGDYPAGAVMGPGTAIISILVVAAVYWGLKSGGKLPAFLGGAGEAAPAAAEAEPEKKSSSSSSKSKDPEPDAAPSVSLPVITPAAFITIFTFVLLAAILIQGPLGIGSVFNSPMPLRLGPSAGDLGQSAIPSLLNVLAKSMGAPMAQAQAAQVLAGQAAGQAVGPPPVAPQMGGQGSKAGPDGTEQWNWFANPLPPLNQPTQGQQQQQAFTGGAAASGGLSSADAMAYASLPALLQGVPFCQTSPSVCAALLANLDLQELARLAGPALGLTSGDLGYQANALAAALGRTPTAQPNPIPLMPAKGFAGSFQGLSSLDNAFYPLLVGAIGLIVLFDYGT